MVARASLSKKLRFDVFKRDGFKCSYCGATPSEKVLLEVDHIHPVAEGGGDNIDNLVTACFNCNRGKGAGLLSSIPDSLEQKAVVVAEREAQIASYYEILRAKRERKDAEAWIIASMYMERFGDEDIRRERLSSIKMFLERLDFYSVMDSMEIAINRKFTKPAAFSYFCGICWNKIKEGEGV